MKSAQAGQVLPVGIALLLIMSVAGLVLYNTGQAATDKARIANTSDAAAYSGLIWQSRAMNFQAYTNRAMVANQVAMAQAVSLNSWSKYAVLSTSNMRTTLGGIPYVNAVVAAANTATEAAASLLEPITKGMLGVSGTVNGALSKSQEAMYLSVFAATPEVISNVVAANDSRFEWDTAFSAAGLANNLNDWKQLTESKGRHDLSAMRERADIIRQSTDDFTEQRNWKFFNNWFPLSPLTFVQAQRYGGTRLIQGGNGLYEWKAKDTVALHTKIYRPFRSKKQVELPIGWAEAYVNSQDTAQASDSIEECGQRTDLCQDWFGRNRLSQSLAEKTPNNEIDVSYSGIQTYRSLSDAIRGSSEKPSVKLRVEVVLPAELINDSANIATGARLVSDIKAVGNKMTSVSTAELYYERPNEEHDANREYANSYNAFWDVRLIETTGYERMAALASRESVGGGVAPKSKLASLQSYRPNQSQPADQRMREINGLRNSLSDVESQLNAVDQTSSRYAVLEDRKVKLTLALNQELASQASGIASKFKENGVSIASAVDVLAIASGNELNHSEYQQVRREIEAYGLNSVADVRATFKDEIDRYGSRHSEAISKQLQDSLKNALANILGGVVNRTSTSRELIELKQEEVDQIIDSKRIAYVDNGIAQSIAAADNAIKDLTEKFKLVRQNVTSQFEGEVTAVRNHYKQRTEALRIRAEQVLDAARGSGEEDVEEARRKANDILRPIGTFHENVVDDLTEKLTDIMKQQMPDYSIHYREIRKAVELALQIDGTEVVDSLHILDLENDNE